MPEKTITELIQTLLDKNHGQMLVSALCKNMTLKQKLGIKSKDNSEIKRKKIEAVTGDNFMFQQKGKSVYILIPFDPSQKVLDLLPLMPEEIVRALHFTEKENVVAIINSLIEEGKAIIKFTPNMKPIVYKADIQRIERKAYTEGYTQEEFRRAFDSLSQGGRAIAVPIYQLRRALGWPREEFDAMLKDLRDKEIITLRKGDFSLMTQDEANDSFIDENGFRRGAVTWDVR